MPITYLTASSTDKIEIGQRGIFFYPSGTGYQPTSSNNSVPQILMITCSLSGSQIASASDTINARYAEYLSDRDAYNTSIAGSQYIRNPFIRIPITDYLIPTESLVSHLEGSTGNDGSLYMYILYYTSSIYNVSQSNPFYYYTSSVTEETYNIHVTINQEDSPSTVATKTYNAITASNMNRYNWISASMQSSEHIQINWSGLSGALALPGMHTSSLPSNVSSQLNFHIIQSGSGNTGFKNVLRVYEASASFQIKRDPSDHTSVVFSVGSSSFGGTEDKTVYYASSSGKVGINTTNPLEEIDFRADTFQIQQSSKRQGILINDEGNIESFNRETAASATGSEIILTYQRGGSQAITADILLATIGVIVEDDAAAQAFYDDQSPDVQAEVLFVAEQEGLFENQTAQIGDTLGSVRWVAASGSTTQAKLKARTEGEAAKIEAVVNASSQFGTSADLLLKVADRAALEAASSELSAEEAAPKTVLRLDGNFRHELTGSLFTTNYIDPSFINQTGTTDNSFAGDIILSNNTVFKGKETGGTNRNMLFMSTNNIVQVGATNNPLSLRSSGNITATGSLIVSDSITAKEGILNAKHVEVWHAGFTIDSITSFINWAGTTEQIANHPKHFTQRVVPYNATMKKFILRLRQKSGNSGIGNNSIVTMYSRSWSDGVDTHTTSSVAPTDGESDLAYSSASFNLNDAPGDYDGLAVLTGSNFSNAVTLNQYDGVSFSIKRGDNDADAIQANVTIVWEYDTINDFIPSGSHT